jgi:hypothetical protein
MSWQIRLLPFMADREEGPVMRREWGLEDLIECWTLDDEESALLANKTGATRLGFALALVAHPAAAE